MLDGILGRGFSAKCKSLMKTTRTRIEVVRRRAEAKQRFLNEDLAKLLSNGLDINAYGRTEEFLAGMNLLWSYDFVEQSCEYIVKQLSRMRKQGECPEECREAVASLMYAAARLSDLPELRELRDLLQQKYGNCLEAFVNQKLVEKLSSMPPPKEKRLQVLKDMASEFSIKWDSRGFEMRMATPSKDAEVDEQKVDIVKQWPGPLNEKKGTQRYGESYHHISRKKETAIEYKEKSLVKSGGSSSPGNVLIESKRSFPVEKADVELNVVRSIISSHGKILDNNVHIAYTRSCHATRNPRIQGEGKERLLGEKANVAPSHVENLAISSYNSSNNALNLVKKGVDEESDRLKSCSVYAVPPPYIKPNHSVSHPTYVKPKKDKHRLRDSKNAVPAVDEQHSNHRSSGTHNKPDHHNYEEQFAAAAELESHGNPKELDYHSDKILPLPKPRSIRRKHHKASSSHDKAVDAFEGLNMSSSSRRKESSRKGLQILFSEEHRVKDDEERMIDKLLIHYSRKPSSYEARKMRKKFTEGESSVDQSSKVHDGKCEVVSPRPTRSVSVPRNQPVSPESKKVFSRSKTFQLDNKARHVHPKLPDYDDLAARFAALKG